MSEIKTWVENLLDSMLIENAEIETNEDDEGRIIVEIKVSEEDSGLIIGYRGETLTAIQRLVRIIFGDKQGEEGKRISVNVNNYRAEREERLRLSTVNAARKVLENGGSYKMHGLTAAERYVVHDEISNNPELMAVESFSEGSGFNRTLVIRIKND